MSRKYRKFSREFKLQVLNEIDAGISVIEASRKYEINDNLIYRWRQKYEKDPHNAFCNNGDSSQDKPRVAELERMIGRLTMENDLLKKVLKRRG